MIYIGHFSFDELGAEKEIRHGYFSCVVETDSADAAVNEFKELILSLKKMNDVFSNMVTVYLEDIIELRDVPQRAIVTRIQSSAGEFPKSISRSLPHVVAPGINVYGWAPDIEADETDRNAGKYTTSKPFIKF
ncbi:MAG: hypothetical protein PVJ82_09520 [Desulfobacteraceae bacterium]|jgi:hypothetical protein